MRHTMRTRQRSLCVASPICAPARITQRTSCISPSPPLLLPRFRLASFPFSVRFRVHPSRFSLSYPFFVLSSIHLLKFILFLFISFSPSFSFSFFLFSSFLCFFFFSSSF